MATDRSEVIKANIATMRSNIWVENDTSHKLFSDAALTLLEGFLMDINKLAQELDNE